MKRSGVIEMYAIIFWKGDKGDEGNKPYPYTDKDATLITFERTGDADKVAFEIEQLNGVDARVISIEGVDE